jgi:hypothetical protein
MLIADGSGGWRKSDLILPRDRFPDGFDIFSASLSADAEYALLGCSGCYTSDQDSGFVYIFARHAPTGQWKMQARIMGKPRDYLGFNVALDAQGIVAAVAAPSAYFQNGAMLIYRRVGVTWSLAARIQPPNMNRVEWTFLAVSMSIDAAGRHVVVSTRSSEALIFGDVGGVWDLRQTLTLDNGLVLPAFGQNVAISGDGQVVLVYAAKDLSGPGYVFEYQRDSSGNFSHTSTIHSPNALDNTFGYALALDTHGDYALISQPTHNSVYGYVRQGNALVHVDTIAVNRTKYPSASRFGWKLFLTWDETAAAISALPFGDWYFVHRSPLDAPLASLTPLGMFPILVGAAVLLTGGVAVVGVVVHRKCARKSLPSRRTRADQPVPIAHRDGHGTATSESTNEEGAHLLGVEITLQPGGHRPLHPFASSVPSANTVPVRASV